MKSGTMTFLTTLILTGVLTIPGRLAAQSSSSEVISFDAPGAGKTAGSGQGTFPDSINTEVVSVLTLAGMFLWPVWARAHA
jgi:hypothetical protein